MLGYLGLPARLLGSLARAVARRELDHEDARPEVAVSFVYAESISPVPTGREPTRRVVSEGDETSAVGTGVGSAYALPTPITRSLPPHPASVTEARTALAPLEVALTPDGFHTLSLLVSELVSNSVLHGAGDGANGIELEVRASAQKVRAVVVDAGPAFAPFSRPGPDDQEGGWGLHLVEALSRRWGVDRDGVTRVWFELEGVTL